MMRPNAPSDAELLKPGTKVGSHFEVQALIGRGGAAAIYRVRDERDGRLLALKRQVCPAGTRSTLMTAQFEREYYTLCQLAHPRIVTVYDYGVDDGTPFYTMELLDGEDLSARRKLPWREVCALCRDVASSLAIIHSRKLVHRDLSLRNVRCTPDGRAKLIDFGALAPMGAVKQVIGTVPFVSPEALQLQALDGRSDLYALGVLAYYMLTGYYPYHARSLTQLKTLWRSPPYGPQRYHRDLPPALEGLVMQLLELDRAARPGSAAEVMERLSGIAGLPLEELPEVRKAYLSMPMLIGREPVLHEVRGALERTQQGQGGCLLIQGSAGMGRSRALDACVLEAKLQGSLLLRADAADSGDEYGLVQALCTQLIGQAPELCDDSAGARKGLLAHVVSELAEGASLPPELPDRHQLQTALCDFIVAIARTRPLVIAVDDLDKVDEASAAVLSGLADRAKPVALCLLLTAQSDVAFGPALALIREIATVLPLPPLTASQSEALLRSVFGDVAHVVGLSEQVHHVTEGNPSLAMTIAEQLVEHGVARYEAGSWALPAELPPGVLTRYLSSALRHRIAALGPDARELSEVLALTDPALLNVSQYRSLTAHADAGRVYEALDGLVAARILIAEGHRYRFGPQGLRELLREGLDAERAKVLHARIAQAFAGSEHRFQLAHHLLLAGEEREALALVLASLGRDAPPPDAVTIELAVGALAAAERLRLPLRERLALREWLVMLTAMSGLPLSATEGLALVEQYERDSGLRDYRSMSPELPEPQRIAAAIERARQRHESTEPSERGFAPEQAMLHLAKFCSYLVAFAAIADDLSLLEQLPSLGPLCEVSPQLAVVRLHIEMQIGVNSGVVVGVKEKCEEIIRRLDRPDHSGFTPEHAAAFRFGIVYILGIFAASSVQPQAREWVAELQRTPGYRANAWRVRMVYELLQGNHEAATVCQRRAELMHLQDSGQAIYPGTTLKIELLAAILTDDLLAVKRLSERIEQIADRYPHWQLALCLARCHYRRLQGDLQGALHELAPALEIARPGRHSDWAMLMAGKVSLLAALGQAQEATRIGLEAIAQAMRAQHWASHTHLVRSVAEAAILAERTADALALLNVSIPRQEQFGPRGIALALSYEVRARLAIALQDQAGLQHYFDLCAQQFAGRRDGLLNRKYERLKQEAEEAQLTLVPHARAPLASALGKRRAPRIAELLVEP